MPRYFFHSADGVREPDRDGTELPDIAAAQLEAIKYAGEVLTHTPETLGDSGQWRVEVVDEGGAHLFTVVTLTVHAPAEDRRRRDRTDAAGREHG